jgi:transposase InsO family protein
MVCARLSGPESGSRAAGREGRRLAGNGVIERFFGTLKYEHLYRPDRRRRRGSDGNRPLRDIYNRIRPHQGLDDRTPRQADLDT